MHKQVDKITLEVIYHRLVSIADEMQHVLIRSSFSSIVKEAQDCTTALFDAEAKTIAQATSIPIHLGTLMEAIPQIIKQFPPSETQEGDVYIFNDPYTGGTHLPDIAMATPIIYKGEIVAYSTSMVHHQDIGGMKPGVSTSATSMYQEGLNLPPVKFYEAGKPVKMIHDIIRNNVRIYNQVLGDLGGQVAAGNVGRLRILEVIDEYGKEIVLGAINQLMDYSEVSTREEIKNLPNKTSYFVDWLDNDGVELDKKIKFQVALTIKKSDIILDFTGSSPQVMGPLNCTSSGSLAAAAYALRSIIAPLIPSNDGCFRVIQRILPEGSIVNPKRPSPTGVRSSTIGRIADTIFGALIKIVPERVAACSGGGIGGVVYFGGTDPLTDKEYVFLDIFFAGQGARPTKDGIDAISQDVYNVRTVPAESLEMNFPFRVLKAGLRENSAGAGEYRGGLGMVKILEFLRGRNASVTFRGMRFYTQPWGIFGGLPGRNAKAFILRKKGKKEIILSNKDLIMNEGDQLHIFSPGGGGYGDPLKRNPETVLRDVLDKRVSIKAAADEYGVVIIEEDSKKKLDLEKTSELRKNKAKVRGPITWIYDRGGGEKER
ncbi:MAG: hydantoinase B/oxoprolinase family protein [Deltaproteobacteria bacterium]|nr:hydantoinase B/oxoprolinase family protein [Deltaproteobacteria bacterium]